MSFRIPTYVDYTRVEGDFVLMNLRSGLYFALDPVASHVWEVLADAGESEPAVQRILARFDVGETQARSDVSELIAELTEKGLLQEVDE